MNWFAVFACAGLLSLQPGDEAWRAGGEDGELYSSISSIIATDQEVYVLDTNDSAIHVYDHAGELQRVLHTEGEGPGQLDHPARLVLINQNTIGLVSSGIAPYLVTIQPDGNPSTHYGTNRIDFSTSTRDLFIINHVAAFGEGFIIAGDNHFGSFLKRFDTIGIPTDVFIELPARSDYEARVFDDHDWYLIDHVPWCIRGSTLSYVPARNHDGEYQIHQINLRTKATETITRDFEPRPRTEQELHECMISLLGPQAKEMIAAGMVGFKPSTELDADIHQIIPRRDGLWVETSRSRDKSGITYTVLGDTVGEVRLSYPDFSPYDVLYLLDEFLIVVKGQWDVEHPGVRNDQDLLEVIAYRGLLP